MPTEVTAKPYLVYHGHNMGRTLYIPCDDGLYTLQQLADYLGIHKMSVLGRAKRKGWIGKGIFHAAKVMRPAEGNEAWMALSDRPRNRNLSKIKPWGKLEEAA